MRDRLQACGADLSRVFVFDKTTGTITLPDDIPWLDTTISEHQVRLLVIDPIFDFLGPNANGDQSVRRALRPLTAMVERRNIVSLLSRHLNKSANHNPIYRGSGSIGLIATARYGMLVAADPADPDRRILAQTKPHLNTTTESLTFRPIFREGGLSSPVGRHEQFLRNGFACGRRSTPAPARRGYGFRRCHASRRPYKARRTLLFGNKRWSLPPNYTAS